MAEPLYCYPFEILCHPLSWWSSAAAWAQALLSALAIVGAAWIAWWQHKKTLGQRVQALTAMAAFAADAADGFMEDMRKYEHKPVARPWNLDLLKEATKAIAAIPAHDLPDDRLIYPTLRLKDGLRELLSLAQALDTSIASTGANIQSHHMNSFETMVGRIEETYGDIVDVNRSVNPLTWRDARRKKNALGN
ncbi:hypothetical protein [Stenotrophomonas maltophilia]|uniref:hypothetical protein n=1 Tax=Stenotrophomonas maltophilia TaxID=40324 RepID=UPI00076C68DD|nr:hypothetical protein [Stenotrophomonas maltophilia]KWV46112.1 hypothetical protein AS591_17305 [Stenotrophomonas maltophilia]MBA0459986.1 hypothetical protein [Stenotrophomonas maltophilia]